MSSIPQISEAEWQIMKILWSKPYITSREVIQMLHDNTEWKPNTVKTLLGRLVKKGAVKFIEDKKDKRLYYYYPAVGEEECVRNESKSFLYRVYDGSISSMMASFVKHNKLSPKEIDELKRILDDEVNKR